MAKLAYLLPRFIRHILPESSARFLLQHGWVIRPGLETRAPLEAAQRYQKVLSAAGRSFNSAHILILGYGGKFTLACELLQLGAAHILLAEKEVFLDHSGNLALSARFGDYLTVKNNQVTPNPQYITLLHGDIRRTADAGDVAPADFVFSNSVYEHLDDVEGITAALVRLSRPEALHVHFVDLRDHFFKYPFEMLCYSQETWLRWLNPSSHHNRWRIGDYRRTFERIFNQVEITLLGSEPAAFAREKARIRSEFLTGNDEMDAVTLIRIVASGVK
ncbi:MAG: hypothetical protein IT308_05155 [Anaerolineaceae bacterium]|nr:hypothetical protein [Anaerolineaceae bacterium]